MANEIKYQINGQLVDNTVTVDNKEDMILVPVSIDSADENRIIAELKAEESARMVPQGIGHRAGKGEEEPKENEE